MPRPSDLKRAKESFEDTRKVVESRGSDSREKRMSDDKKKRKKASKAKKSAKIVKNETSAKTEKSGKDEVAEEIGPVRITDDVDFARDDYDGRIQRCKERIRDGFHEKTYRDKIKSLQAAKKARAEIEAQYAGKSFESIKRIGALEMIENYLAKNGDPCGELENVRAVLAAYNADELEWDGNTTFWCEGKKIAGPMPFTWDDFRKYNTEENRGAGGFWVEGADDPSKEPAGARNVFNYVGPTTIDKLMIRYNLTIRLDVLSGKNDVNGDPFPELNLQFVHDTGCTDMLIYDEDMKAMMGANAKDDIPKDHMMGYSTSYLADGTYVVSRTIAVEVNLVGYDVKTKEPSVMVQPWTTIRCDITEPGEGEAQGVPRLDGNWSRSMLYTACVPEATNRLFVSTHKSGLVGVGGLPHIPETERTGPKCRQPNIGVIFKYDDEAKKWTATANPKKKGFIPAHAYC